MQKGAFSVAFKIRLNAFSAGATPRFPLGSSRRSPDPLVDWGKGHPPRHMPKLTRRLRHRFGERALSKNIYRTALNILLKTFHCVHSCMSLAHYHHGKVICWQDQTRVLLRTGSSRLSEYVAGEIVTQWVTRQLPGRHTQPVNRLWWSCLRIRIVFVNCILTTWTVSILEFS